MFCQLFNPIIGDNTHVLLRSALHTLSLYRHLGHYLLQALFIRINTPPEPFPENGNQIYVNDSGSLQVKAICSFINGHGQEKSPAMPIFHHQAISLLSQRGAHNLFALQT